MIDSTAVRAATTHILCCSCGMYFSAAASSENDHGSMNLASNTAPLASTRPSSVAAIQRSAGCWTRCLDIRDDLPGIGLVPAPVEVLGDQPRAGRSRLPDRSSGSTSPRFSRHSRSRAASSSPMMIRASEPPMKERR